MPLSKLQKQKIIEDLKGKLSRQKAAIFTDIQGLRVKNLTGIRKKLRAQDIDYKMVKKSLFKIALSDNFGFNPRAIEGEMAVAFGYQDEILPAKIIYDFSRKNENLRILGGIVGGRVFSKDEIIILAKLPSREQLLAKLVGSLAAPISGFLNVLQGNLRNLVYILSNIKAN